MTAASRNIWKWRDPRMKVELFVVSRLTLVRGVDNGINADAQC
jgi:hypothetical protein